MKSEKRAVLLLDLGVLIFGVTARFLAEAMIGYLPDCVFARVGITCPSCGATRCVRAFFSGAFAEAFLLHPFLFCLILYAAAAFVCLNIGYLCGQPHCQTIGKAMTGSKAIITLAILYAIFGTVRMLLTFPG